MQQPVELERRLEVAPERLLDDDAAALLSPTDASFSATVGNMSGGMAM